MKNYKGNIILFYIYTSCMFFYLWLPIWMIFFQKEGMNLTQIGMLDAVTFILVALLEIPSGAIADTYGRKYSLAFGAFIYGIGMFGVIFNVMSPLFLIGYVVWHLSTSFISGTNMAFLFDTLAEVGKQDEYKKVVGRIRAIIQGSVAIGGVLGAIVASQNPMYCFFIAGSLGIVASIIALILREPSREQENTNPNEKNSYFNIIKKAFQVSILNPKVRYLMLINTIISAVYFLTIQIFLQPYATEVKFPIASIGLLLLFIQGAGVLGSMISHKIKKINDYTQIIIVLFVFVIAQVFLGVLHSPIAIFLFVMIAFSNSIIVPTLTNLLNLVIPSEQRATILSLQSLLWTSVVAVGELVLLRFADIANVSSVLYVISVFIVLTMLPLLFLWKNTDKKATRSISIKTTV